MFSRHLLKNFLLILSVFVVTLIIDTLLINFYCINLETRSAIITSYAELTACGYTNQIIAFSVLALAIIYFLVGIYQLISCCLIFKDIDKTEKKQIVSAANLLILLSVFIALFYYYEKVVALIGGKF